MEGAKKVGQSLLWNLGRKQDRALSSRIWLEQKIRIWWWRRGHSLEWRVRLRGWCVEGEQRERERERVEGGRRRRYRIFRGCLCVCVGVSMCFCMEPDMMSWGAVRTRELWHSRIS